jgi:hypothetical protein
MATKEDFTEQEWAALADGPQLAGIAVMVAGSSGIVGSIKEAAAAAHAVWDGITHSHELIRLLSSKEEMQTSQARIRDAMDDFGGKDPSAWVEDQTIATLQALN